MEDKKERSEIGDWYIVLRHGSPLTMYNGALDLNAINSGRVSVGVTDDTINRHLVGICDRFSRRGYVQALKKASKFPYQLELFLMAGPRTRHVVTNAEGLDSLSKSFMMECGSESSDVMLDFAPVEGEKDKFILLGLSVDGFYPFMDSYDEHMESIGIKRIIRVHIPKNNYR